MNQILVTKKLYITPELKKKRKAYKVYFFLSLFLICILVSIFAYTEIDRTKGEEASSKLLDNFNKDTEETELENRKQVLVAVLDGNNDGSTSNDTSATLGANAQKNINKNKKEKNQEGYTYSKIASINIPKINVQYTILEGTTGTLQETESLIKMSPAKFWGPEPNQVGNFCIVGHNYRNTKFFSKVPNLTNGDVIEITDSTGKTLKYSVYNKYEVDPSDISCLDQDTNGQKEVTLITCTNDSKLRVIVKAKAI